jgi:hypothetical protein
MNVDCRWISHNLEAYYFDRLSAEESALARTHMDNCAPCREEIRSLRAVDSLVRKHFHRQLAIAQMPKRRRAAAFVYGGAAGVAAAAFLLIALLRTDPLPAPAAAGDMQLPQASVPAGAAPQPAVIKSIEAAPPERSKPTPATAAAASPRAPAPAPLPPDAPAFLVTDPAGYSRSLADYRGYVLIVGVWSSDHPESFAALERLYQTFSANSRIRILGVSNEHQVKPAKTTFPVAYNQGSRLLSAQAGDFVVVDPGGSIQLRGSLSRDFETLVDWINR